jgi:aromatic amino acid transport protein AroP
MAMIVCVMLMIPGIRASVFAIPVWVLIIFGFYRMRMAKDRALPIVQ